MQIAPTDNDKNRLNSAKIMQWCTAWQSFYFLGGCYGLHQRTRQQQLFRQSSVASDQCWRCFRPEIQGDPPVFPSRIRASLYVLSAHRGRSCSDADMLFFFTRYPIARTTRLSVWMLAFSPSFVRSSARVMSGVSSMHWRMCCLSSPFSSCFLPCIVQHFAHFSHLPVTYCTTFCCNCQVWLLFWKLL